ncbi:Uncharacterized protein FWK35_00027983 [Aphis craccivora]|uniref:Uncharacterized protein n=1 Tax=Aphis craccivora TaxID=307492 RepID=A0A6G0YN38_APHCR|nr:Uncharacterized protein FWK35_00027983 [Aphis craccivora]
MNYFFQFLHPFSLSRYIFVKVDECNCGQSTLSNLTSGRIMWHKDDELHRPQPRWSNHHCTRIQHHLHHYENNGKQYNYKFGAILSGTMNVLILQFCVFFLSMYTRTCRNNASISNFGSDFR